MSKRADIAEEQFHHQLVQRYAEGRCTEAELEVFFQTLSQGRLGAILRESMNSVAGIGEADPLTEELAEEVAAAELAEEVAAGGGRIIRLPRVLRPFAWPRPVRIAVVAALFALLAGGIFLLNRPASTNEVVKALPQPYKNEVSPGGNRAVLTLAGGTKIVLDSAANGQLTIQGNAHVIKADSGKLTYQPAGNVAGTASVYNTLSTPRGGQFQLTLPDGTLVWLNAASSISYPTVFAGKQRTVTITGEVYFEVAKDKAKPFYVKGEDMDVEVLGTHFNINSYGDEFAIKTTLLEGSIRISRGFMGGAVLHPGQQALVPAGQQTLVPAGQRQNNGHQPNNPQSSPAKQIRILDKADIDQVMAWKNGLFKFDDADLGTVMRQLSRWYDVEVVYEGRPPVDRFFVIMSRNSPLLSVLKALQAGGVKFRIEGRRVIVEAQK